MHRLPVAVRALPAMVRVRAMATLPGTQPSTQSTTHEGDVYAAMAAKTLPRIKLPLSSLPVINGQTMDSHDSMLGPG